MTEESNLSMDCVNLRKNCARRGFAPSRNCRGQVGKQLKINAFIVWHADCIKPHARGHNPTWPLIKTNQTIKKIEHSMKIKLAMLAVAAALCVSGGTLLAQDNGGGGGGRRFGGGNFDPAQFQQRMMDNIKDQLGFTNDTDWNAVQPLVQKVFDARREASANMFRAFGRRNRGGGDNGGGGNRFGRQPNPDAEALQQAIDSNAPASQIKTLLDKYRASEKQKQAALEAAQENLAKVLNQKQEAQAVLMGLLN